MLNKKEVKDIQSLNLKKFRDSLGLFIAEGPKIVAELAAGAPGQLHRVYALQSWADAHAGLAQGLPLTIVNDIDLARISQLQTPNEAVAVLRTFVPTPPLPDVFTLYLDTIQDPGNMGTIIRIADWFGIRQIVCSTGCADRYNPKVVQSTMASLARVNIWEDAGGTWLSGQSMPRYAAVLDGRPLNEYGKVDKGILMIGNESKGLSPAVLAHASDTITIPRRGAAESLNAAVATGIIVSHLLS